MQVTQWLWTRWSMTSTCCPAECSTRRLSPLSVQNNPNVFIQKDERLGGRIKDKTPVYDYSQGKHQEPPQTALSVICSQSIRHNSNKYYIHEVFNVQTVWKLTSWVVRLYACLPIYINECRLSVRDSFWYTVQQHYKVKHSKS